MVATYKPTNTDSGDPLGMLSRETSHSNKYALGSARVHASTCKRGYNQRRSSWCWLPASMWIYKHIPIYPHTCMHSCQHAYVHTLTTHIKTDEFLKNLQVITQLEREVGKKWNQHQTVLGCTSCLPLWSSPLHYLIPIPSSLFFPAENHGCVTSPVLSLLPCSQRREGSPHSDWASTICLRQAPSLQSSSKEPYMMLRSLTSWVLAIGKGDAPPPAPDIQYLV